MNVAVYLFHPGAERHFTTGTFGSSQALAAELLKHAPFATGFLLVARLRLGGKLYEIRINFDGQIVQPANMQGECDDIAKHVMRAAMHTVKTHRPELLQHVAQ